ncbi:MAG: hypothetical protein ACTSXZ_10305 [Alphaproteobacteria bacterium]
MRADEAADLERERVELRRRLIDERGMSEAEAEALVAKGENPQAGLGFLIFHPGISPTPRRIAVIAVIALIVAALVLWG